MERASVTGATGEVRAIEAIAAPMAVMRRVVDEALLLIPAADGAVVELADRNTLTYACTAGNLSGHVGLRLDSAASFSGLAVRTGKTLICADSRVDRRVDAESCRRVGAISMICVPLLRSGRPVGVLKVSASKPAAFTDRDVRSLAQLAEFISWAVATAKDLADLYSTADRSPPATADPLGADPDARSRFMRNVLRPDAGSDSQTADRIRSAITSSSIQMVCQPIIELHSGQLAGAEALARFPQQPRLGPERWFADARRVGLGTELELAAVHRALHLLRHVPEPAYLAVNASAPTVLEMERSGLLERYDPGRIVIEVTEHLEVDDHPELPAALIRLRRQGIRIAIDDTGSGFSTFAHILKLAPDIIKLDRILTTGIDLDPVRRALAGALATFAQQTGAKVVAEGIETQSELDTVVELGITYGQGFHLGRPTAAPQLRHSQHLTSKPVPALGAHPLK